MKLNDYVRQSNITIEGYNNKTSLWELMGYCANNRDGPMEWTKYDCIIKIPHDVSKIRPVLNADTQIIQQKQR